MNKQIKIGSLLAAMLLVIVGACNDDPPLPDNLTNFETSAAGFSATSSAAAETQVKIKLVRTEDAAVPVTLSLKTTNLTYGTHFTTDPAATSGKLVVTVPAGATEVSFKVIKPDGVFLNGDETIDFTITDVAQPALLGTTLGFKLSFSAITSDGSTLTLTGKTDASPYANEVFVDLSENQQIPVDRKSWNLGFSGGSTFRVYLNQAYQSTTTALAKTDITTVTIADANTAPDLNFSPGGGTLSMVDKWDATDLTTTAFAEVSATDADNKVYLLSFEGSKDKDKWFKVKVNRDGTTGYKIQYARVGDTAIKTLTVAKDAQYNFTFVSLENDKIVSVEPFKASWDIAWSYGTYNSGLNTPYWFQDFITLNFLGGVEASEVVSTGADATAAATASAALYTSFAESNIAGLTFLKSNDAIGSKWRVTQPATGVRRDRFYVIKDAKANYYKLKFVTMGVGDTGVRGNVVIEYKLVKKGS